MTPKTNRKHRQLHTVFMSNKISAFGNAICEFSETSGGIYTELKPRNRCKPETTGRYILCDKYLIISEEKYAAISWDTHDLNFCPPFVSCVS